MKVLRRFDSENYVAIDFKVPALPYVIKQPFNQKIYENISLVIPNFYFDESRPSMVTAMLNNFTTPVEKLDFLVEGDIIVLFADTNFEFQHFENSDFTLQVRYFDKPKNTSETINSEAWKLPS